MRYNLGVDQLSRDLAESLAAAVAAKQDIHFDVCSVYTESREYGCSCGIPRLLTDLAAFLDVHVEDHADSLLLPETA